VSEPAAPGGGRIAHHGPGMAGRRVIAFVVSLLVIGAVASALAPRERALRGPAPAVEAAPQAPPAKVVRATLTEGGRVRARVGDVVQIQVRGRAEDVVQVPALGLEEPVEPGLPALLVFDADRAGRFGVSLRDAGRRIGTIVVRPAG
jgi:hypothetical protein